MLTVNSFLHHVYDYRAVLREIDRVLKPGGYLVLAHEPNREFFRSPLIRLAASAWKLAGFGMTVPKDLCDRINVRLREVPPRDVGGRSGMTSFDWSSITRRWNREPSDRQNKGFSPRDLLEQELRGYDADRVATSTRRSIIGRCSSVTRG